MPDETFKLLRGAVHYAFNGFWQSLPECMSGQLILLVRETLANVAWFSVSRTQAFGLSRCL